MKIWSEFDQFEAEKPSTKHLFQSNEMFLKWFNYDYSKFFAISKFVPYVHMEKIDISEANFSKKKDWTILPILFKTFHQNLWDFYQYILVNQLNCFCLRQLCYYYHCFDIKSEVSIKTYECTQNSATGASYLLCNLYAPSFYIWIAFIAFFLFIFSRSSNIFFPLFIFKVFIFIHESKTFIHNCSMKYKNELKLNIYVVCCARKELQKYTHNTYFVHSFINKLKL